MIKQINSKSIIKIFSVFVILQVFWFQNTNSQSFGYFSVGYNGTKSDLKNFNYVIDRYNETRTWLSSKLDNINYLDGVCFNFGGGWKRGFFDISWSNRSDVKIAKGDNGSVIAERELKLRMNNFSFSKGFTIGGIDGFLPIYFGLSIDLCQLKVFTRTANLGQLKQEDYILAHNKFLPATSIFFQHIITGRGKSGGIGLLLKPYVQIPWYTTDFFDVNAYLNPYTYQNDPLELKTLAINYGFSVSLVFFGK